MLGLVLLFRRYDDIAVCVRRATSTCPVEPSSHSVSFKKKQVWSGLDASFNFICKNGKRSKLHASSSSSSPPPPFGNPPLIRRSARE